MTTRASGVRSPIPSAPGFRARISAAVVAVVVALGLLGPAGELPQADAAQPAILDGSVVADHDGSAVPADSANGPAQRLTLVTGDVVVVTPTTDGDPLIDIEAHTRPDGADVAFATSVDARDGTIQVIPSDAAELLAAGRLDPLLFDVTYLLDNGFADADRSTVPLIVQGGPGAARWPNTALRATLQSVAAEVLHVDKGGAGAAWSQTVLGGDRHGAEAPASIWLDRPARIALSESTVQVGAPAAWSAGLDGSGVTVAVIDTGWDPEHPHLVDQVVAAESFVPDETVVDGHGHGTHVASTVAGTGDPHGGVAPGADLLVAKALADNGTGDISHVIEAMEWAVLDHGADVVNLSLGADPTDGSDPASIAVDALTEEGALFVVAAGNDGPNPFTVGAPGAADSALTIGSVDKSDVIAGDSSSGPRLGDHAIKPEMAAPGVGIVAARAAGTSMGTPVDELHTSASGTSMATPHVAGAAALVLQQRPDLSPESVKAVLMGSSLDVGHGVYRQGAGRLDIARLIDHQLTAAPPTADFGFIDWPPSGTPTTRSVTVTNDADQDLSLSLSLEAVDPTGAPVPDDVLWLDLDEVTVPADGTADIEVTLDQATAASGLHSGRIDATTATGDALSIPVGFSIEEEQHTLGVDVTERTDVTTFEVISVQVYAVSGSAASQSFAENCLTSCPDGRAEFDLPEGIYSTISWVRWFGSEGERHFGVLLDPEVHLDASTDITLVSDDLNPMTFDLPRPSEPQQAGPFTVRRTTADVSHTLISVLSSSESVNWWLAPTQTAQTGEFSTGSPWLFTAPGDAALPDYVYSIKAYEDDAVRAEPHYAFTDDDLAIIDSAIHADDDPTDLRLQWSQRRPAEFVTGGTTMDVVGPGALREYIAPAAPGSLHQRTVNEQPPGPFPTAVAMTEIEAGPGSVRWNTRPVVPGAIDAPPDPEVHGIPFPQGICVGCRQGDTFNPFLHHTTAEPAHTAGRSGIPSSTGTMTMTADGEPVAEAEPTSGAFTAFVLAEEETTYQLHLDELDVETSWGFTSATVTDEATPPGFVCPATLLGGSSTPCQAEPLILLRYDAELDLDNTAPSPGTHRLGIDAYHVAADAPAITDLSAQVSTDGSTWSDLDLQDLGDGAFRADVQTDDPDEVVSLRVVAADADGNTVEQTVWNAYGLHERIEPELVDVVVTPSETQIVTDESESLTASARYDDESSVDVTESAEWSSSDDAVATVTDGVVTGVAEGVVEVTAAFGGVSGTAMVTVVADDDDDPEPPGPPGPPGEPGPPDPGEPLPEGVVRVSGSNRFETAITISQATFGDGEAGSVVLARGDDFADSLAGTPLAVDRDAPVLLTVTDTLIDVVADEIGRVLPAGGTVYLLGGTAALDASVEADLVALGYTPVRLAGPERIGTSLAVANELAGDPGDILITNGFNFPDALAAGAAGAEVDGVVILTTPDTPDAQVDAFLTDNPTARVTAVGGPAARAYPDAIPVFGPTRETTAVAVAETFFDTPAAIAVARQDDFADALAGGAHIGRLGGPLLLTPDVLLHPDTEAYLCANADTITTGFVYGGTAAVSDEVTDLIGDAIDGLACP